MTLTFHYHPLASFCHKPLIALYENETAFDSVIVDFGNQASAEAFRKLWPMAKMPVLVDAGRFATVAESTVVIDYLDLFHPGAVRFVPADPNNAWRVRFWDRFFDNYVHLPMQKIVGDALRPEAHRDPTGVAEAKAQIAKSYGYLETQLTDGWMVDGFSLADCAAAPALFYANTLQPIPGEQPKLRGYLRRLMQRPSFSRALREAEPYFAMFPLNPKPSLTPPD